MQSEPKIAAIILCAGQGTRAGGQVAKQWQPLAGKRVIDWVITRFDQHPKIDVMVIVHPNGEGHHFTDNPSHLKYVVGGDSRSQSVCNGLAALETTAPDLVLIHDGARPCVTDEIIDVCIEHLNHHTAVAPAVAVTDTLWMGENGIVGDVVDRSALFQAQTPQCFVYQDIFAAHNSFVGTATDDVQVAQAAGIKVAIVPGDPDNIKITTPQDFDRAERILKSQ